MHGITKLAALSLGTLALAAPAAAQEDANPYLSDDPIVFATLDIWGSGNFTGVIDPDTNELCYILNADGVEQPTAAHIHVGGPGEDGAPVVPLETPADGASGGCVTLEADIARALAESPGGYYVNVHSEAYPQGAQRGQLRG